MDIARTLTDAKTVSLLTSGCHADLVREHSDINDAIWCEKKIKKWKRAWKLELFRDSNPDWHDLYPGLVAAGPPVR